MNQQTDILEFITVKRYICKCGKSRMHTVIVPGKKFSYESRKDQAELDELGLESEIITLEEARKAEMCFDCKL